MKILAILGSPRKGETYAAVQRLEQRLRTHAAVEVEYLMLSHLRLPDCAGCHSCIYKGREACWQAEPLRQLQDKMTAADAVILASPVYNQGVTAIMKKFLDYFTFLWHRPELFGVKFFGISSGGGMFQGVFKTLRESVHSWGGTWMGSLGVPHYEALTPKARRKADAELIRAADIFLRGLGSKELPRPNFMALMRFRVWRMNAIACRSSIPADYECWLRAGWFTQPFYYDTKINPVVRLCADAAAVMTRRFLRGVYIGY